MPTSRRKPKPGDVRLQRFKAALALSDMTMEQWAAKQQVSYGHLWQVVTDRRQSPPLCAKVEQFTNETLADAQRAVA